MKTHDKGFDFTISSVSITPPDGSRSQLGCLSPLASTHFNCDLLLISNEIKFKISILLEFLIDEFT